MKFNLHLSLMHPVLFAARGRSLNERDSRLIHYGNYCLLADAKIKLVFFMLM